MSGSLPDYLAVPAGQLGCGTSVKVCLGGDLQDVARRMADDMRAVVAEARAEGRRPTLIVPVGPVDQYPILAGLVNDRRDDWRRDSADSTTTWKR